MNGIATQTAIVGPIRCAELHIILMNCIGWRIWICRLGVLPQTPTRTHTSNVSNISFGRWPHIRHTTVGAIRTGYVKKANFLVLSERPTAEQQLTTMLLWSLSLLVGRACKDARVFIWMLFLVQARRSNPHGTSRSVISVDWPARAKGELSHALHTLDPLCILACKRKQ